MMIKNTILAVLMLAAPLTVAARGDAAAGQEKAKVCEACHGATGKSIDPNYPDIGGQHKDYLEKALRDYRSGHRPNLIMAGMASGLSDQDIEDLAAWFSSQEGLIDLSEE